MSNEAILIGVSLLIFGGLFIFAGTLLMGALAYMVYGARGVYYEAPSEGRTERDESDANRD